MLDYIMAEKKSLGFQVAEIPPKPLNIWVLFYLKLHFLINSQSTRNEHINRLNDISDMLEMYLANYLGTFHDIH